MNNTEKAKPSARRGRKASGPRDAEAAGLSIKAARFYFKGYKPKTADYGYEYPADRRSDHKEVRPFIRSRVAWGNLTPRPPRIVRSLSAKELEVG